MKLFYDLHLHSCLSPCGDADMTPNNLVNMALLNGMQLIALTDHNSCKNCRAAVEVGERAGLCVVPGMELCTSEEAHVVCLFPTVEAAEAFGGYVAAHSPRIKNKPRIFGEQLILDQEDQELGREEFLLLTAANISVNQVCALTARYGGAAFPAHIDRDSYSVLSSLGELPKEAGFRAAEITAKGDVEALKRLHPELEEMILFLDSDAHYLENMPAPQGWIDLPAPAPQCLIDAILGKRPAQWGR